MRIARFTTGDDPAYGLVDGTGEKIAEITGDPLYQRIELTGTVHEIDDVRLLAPVIPRSKVIGIGRNYADHAKEMGNEAPAEPMMFLMPNTAVVGPGDPVVMPPQTAEVGYEGELAVVIGRLCQGPRAAGRPRRSSSATPCANDVTARDLQRSDGQWARAKGFDTFCPLGPWIETDLDPATSAHHHPARRRGRAGRPDLRHGARRGRRSSRTSSRRSRCCPATSSSPAPRPGSARSSRASGSRSRWTASGCSATPSCVTRLSPTMSEHLSTP